MDIDNLKITDADYYGKDIAGLPDTIAGEAANVKARFDALVKDVVAPRFNDLIDDIKEDRSRDSYGYELPETANEGDAFDLIITE